MSNANKSNMNLGANSAKLFFVEPLELPGLCRVGTAPDVDEKMLISDFRLLFNELSS